MKEAFARGVYAEFKEDKIRKALYRPFTKRFLFFDSIINHRQGIFPQIFPTVSTETENTVICVKIGSEWPMFALVSNCLVAYQPQSGSQCFPFYVYNENGSNRRENITDWSLKKFQDHYHNPSITKWDIFYYVYGMLHHPGYREKFADNLKRELPRIPFARTFRRLRPPANSLPGCISNTKPLSRIACNGSNRTPCRCRTA